MSFNCPKSVPQADREIWSRDFSMLKNLTSSNAIPEKLVEHFEFLETFIPVLPQKQLKLESFINEFDILATHFNIDTPIGREDGRPFAGLVSSKFDKSFVRLASDSLYPPYNESFGDSASENTAGEGPGASTLRSQKGSAWADVLDENTRSIYSGIWPTFIDRFKNNKTKRD